MIRVFVEVTGVAAPLRVEVRAEGIGQAVATIEELHPDRTVQVVFPIDPEEFFIEDSQDARAGHDRSGTHVQATAREAWAS